MSDLVDFSIDGYCIFIGFIMYSGRPSFMMNFVSFDGKTKRQNCLFIIFCPYTSYRKYGLKLRELRVVVPSKTCKYYLT